MRSKRCSIIIASLLVFGGFLIGTDLMIENASAQISWDIEGVDTGHNDVGMYSDIALDANGYPHISYYDNITGDLKYAKWNGSDWEIEIVDTTSDVGLYTSIALDSSGYAHISYLDFIDGELKYANWTGSSWNIEIIDYASSWGSTSIALDSNNNPHIIYLDKNLVSLMYARWTGTIWAFQMADDSQMIYDYFSLAINSSNYPHISGCDAINGNLVYISWTGILWNKEIIDSVECPFGRGYTSIALDSNGYPHISYYDNAILGLKYAQWTGSLWSKDIVDFDLTLGVGQFNSMVLDNNDNPHFSYYDATNRNLKSATWEPFFGWVVQVVDIGADLGLYTSIALDNINNAHISYFDYANQELKYAKWTGVNWNIVRVDTSIPGHYTSIALDNFNIPHISYYDDFTRDLKYAKWSGSAWSVETVDSIGNVGQYTSIAIDSSNYPHISYYDALGGNLKYARWIGSTWTIQSVDSGSDVGLYTSVAIDSNDNPHISYYSNGAGLMYAQWTGSSWEYKIVDSSGWFTSIVLDINDYPYISYYDATNKDLKFAKWDGISWTKQTIDSIGNVGKYTSIALDNNDYPLISYFDETSDNLKYARWTGSTWINETVDSIGIVGRYTSIALDNVGNPHISYYDSTNENLKYARWTGYDWKIETVDLINSVGQYTSIALDENNNPHISYYDASLENLKYVTGTGTKPSAPMGLSATTGNSYVNLTWSAPSDGGYAITGYNIYRNGTVGVYDSVSANQLWYNDTNVNNGISYTYNVSAFNGVGEGPNSTISAIPITIPSAPQNLQVIVGDGWVNLTWNAPYDGGSPIITYNIYRNRTAGVYDSVSASQIWYIDTNVINGIIYTYNVSGINDIGEGPNSTISAKPMTVPLAPENLQANSGDSFVNLTWTAPSSDGGSAIIAYNIYRNGTMGVYATVPAVQLWHNDVNVINGISYTYNISALNGVGEGPNSIISATPMTAPSVPQNLQANSGDSYVNLTWNAPTSNGGSPIIVYNIYRNGTVGVYIFVPVNQLWFNDSNLINGVTYTYNVSAINSVDEGPNSTISATPMTIPTAPQNLQAISGDRYVNLIWNMPTDDGGSPIMNYAIYRGTISNGEIFLTEIGANQYYNDTSVSNGITYYYKVSAKNVNGEGILSNEVSATPVTVPLTPTDFTATPGNGEVTLSWSKPSSDGGSAITTYRIYGGTSRDNLTILVELGDDVLTYTDTGLANGNTYYYKVSAVNAAGEGLASSEVSAIPELSIGQPARGILEEFWWLLLLIVLFMIIAVFAMLYLYREKKIEEAKEGVGKLEEEVVTSEEAIEKPKGKMPSPETIEATKQVEAETLTPPTPKKVVKKPLQKVYQKRMVAKKSDMHEAVKEDREKY